MDFDPEKLCAELSKRGLDWADKEAAYRALDDATKSIHGQAYLRTDGTVAERDAEARTSESYMTHLHAVAAARKSALVAKVNYETWQVFMEMKRTQESTKRAEMNLR